jgi:DNA uptake protein ComE-like DNA-binding protein
MTAEQLEQIRAKITTVPAGTAVRRQLAGRASEDAVHVPGDMSRPIASGKKKADLNTANLKTLAAVPSIGPELAPAIIAARPFASVDELNRVPGINAERLEQIRADVSVTPVAKNPRR